MFKKILTSALILLIITPISLTMAAKTNVTTDKIALYNTENAKKPIKWLSINQYRLVPIIRHHEWIKVGLQPSGEVGWINIKQYQQAINQYYKPQSESFSVTITRDQSTGEPTRHIEATRNGKKLSQHEAKELYQRMQAEQGQFTVNFFDSPFLTGPLVSPFRLIEKQSIDNIPFDNLPELESVDSIKQ